MAKKKEQPVIYVKNPKIGKEYYFKFAGTWSLGILTENNDKLTSHYGYKWYTFERMEFEPGKREKRLFKYPVNIFNIREKQEDLN